MAVCLGLPTSKRYLPSTPGMWWCFWVHFCLMICWHHAGRISLPPRSGSSRGFCGEQQWELPLAWWKWPIFWWEMCHVEHWKCGIFGMRVDKFRCWHWYWGGLSTQIWKTRRVFESLFIFLMLCMFYWNPQVLELEKSDEVASHQWHAVGFPTRQYRWRPHPPLEQRGVPSHPGWNRAFNRGLECLSMICPHTLGRYPKLPQTPHKERNSFINCWWNIRGPSSRGPCGWDIRF